MEDLNSLYAKEAVVRIRLAGARNPATRRRLIIDLSKLAQLIDAFRAARGAALHPRLAVSQTG